MGRFIVKLKDYYLEWSTIVDAPVTFGMSLVEFTEHYRQMYGEEGMRELPSRLARVEVKGTSSQIHAGAEEVIDWNRAGPDETSLTEDEIYRAYCLHEPIRDGWTVPLAAAPIPPQTPGHAP